MKTVIVKVNDAVQTIAEHQVVTKDGQPTVIKATDKVNYELVDQASGRAPDHIITKRVGQDLHVSIDEGGQESDLIIEGFYDDPDSALIGLAEEGSYYYYVPDTGEISDYVTELVVGDIEGQALGGNPYQIPYWVGAATSDFNALPWLVGLAGIGIIGAALSNSGGSSSSNNYIPPSDTTAPDAPTVDDITNTDTDGDGTTDTTTITGTTEPGANVDVTDEDGNVIGSTTADENGDFSVDVPVVDENETVNVTATDEAGNESDPTKVQGTDDSTAPNAPTVDDITNTDTDGDGTTDTTTITGTTEPGANVEVTDEDGNVIGSTTADENGDFSVDVPVVDENETVNVTATDEAGNKSDPTKVQGTNDTTPPTAEFAPDAVNIVADADNDGTINSAEANGATTTDVTIAIPEGLEDNDQIVITDQNGAILGTLVIGQDGVTAGSTQTVSGIPLPAEGETLSVTATITDAVGNVGDTASDSAVIDIVAPTQTTEISTIIDDVAPKTGAVANGGDTNDVTPTIEGTISSVLNDGETVVVYRNGEAVGTATVDNTTWTFTDTALADGETYTYTARVEDAAGNQGSDSNDYAINVDTTAPTQSVVIKSIEDDVAPQTGVVGNGETTNDTAPLLTGTLGNELQAGETVVVLRNGAVIGTAEVTGTGWRYADSGLTDGESYIYTARVEDAAGNRGAISNNYRIELDTTAPTQTTEISTIIDDVAPQTGAVENGGVTDDTTPVLQGTISTVLIGSEEVVIYRDGERVGTATVDNTTWSFEDSGLSSGADYTYTAQVEDAAGNAGANSLPYELSVDTGGPSQSTTITAVQDDVEPQTGVVNDGSFTNDIAPTIEGSISAELAPNENVVVLRNGEVIGNATVDGTTWTFDDSGLEDGQTYEYTAYVINEAGIPGGLSNGYSIEIDTTAPMQATQITTVIDDVAPGLGEVADGEFTNDDTPEIRGTIDSELGTDEMVAVYRDGVQVGVADVDGTNWSYTDSSLASGSTYEYTARVIDDAGNEGTLSNDYTIAIDTSGSNQSVQILTVIDDVEPQTGVVDNGSATNDTAPRITGAISTALTGTESMVVLRDGEVIGEAAVDGTTWTFDDSGLEDGQTYTYTARVETAGGNQSPASQPYSIEIDTTAPTQATQITTVIDDVALGLGEVADGEFTNDDTPEIRGTIDNALSGDEMVAVYRDGVQVGIADVEGTNWSYTDSSLASGSTYEYTARVIDDAGNEGTLSNDYTIAIDTSGSNQSVQILTVIDDVEPQTGVVDNGGATNDTAPRITGAISTALTGTQSVVVLRDGEVVGNATVEGTTWTFDDSGLEDGQTYTYTARVETAGGNQSPASQPYSIEIDTTDPVDNIINITSITDDTGSDASDFITNDQTLVFNGTLQNALSDGETVQVSLDEGTTWVDATTDGTAWTYDNTGNELAEGEYTIQARIVDTAGNVGAADSQLVKIDITAPPAAFPETAITIVADSNDDGLINTEEAGDGTTDVTVDIPAELVDGDQVTVTDNNGNELAVYTVGPNGVAAGSTQTITGVALPADGETLTVTAQITDAAGNPGNSATDSATVDLTAPPAAFPDTAITIVADGNNDGLINTQEAGDGTTDVTVDIPAELVDGDQVTVTDNNGNELAVYTVGPNGVAAGSTQTITGVQLPADGETLTVTAQITDAAGNAGNSADDSATVDLTDPTAIATIESYVDDVAPIRDNASTTPITNDDRVTLNGTLSEALSDGESVNVYADGELIGEATVTGTSWTLDNVAVTETGATYTVATVDEAGNVTDGQGSLEIALDDTRPTIIANQSFSYDENLTPVAGETEVVIGRVQAEDNSGITSYTITAGNDMNFYTINDQGDLILTAAGQNSAANDFESTPNSFGLTVEVTDAAGNTNSALVTTNVQNINEAPVAEDTTITTEEDTEVTGTLPAAIDPDVGDTANIVYSVGEQPTNGTVTINANGRYSYVPAQDYNGEDSFTYTVTDPGGASNTYTVTVSVTPVNDPPELAGDLQADVVEGYFTILTTEDINFTDVDNDAAAQTFNVSNLVNGTLQVNGAPADSFTFAQLENGEVAFYHDGSATDTASFDINVEDGNEDNSTPVNQTFTLNVLPPPEITTITIDDDNVIDPTADGGTDTEISGVTSDNFGAGYLYAGRVSQGENGVITSGPLDGLTNDTTPTITVTLNEALLPDGFQEIQVTRYIDDPVQGLIEGTVVATSTNGLTANSDSTEFTFTDDISVGEDDLDTVYRYEAQIVNISDRVTSDEATDLLLDTEALTPIVSGYSEVENAQGEAEGTITGIFTEEGVVFVDLNENRVLDPGESWAVVAEDGTWSLDMTATETALLLDQDNYSVGSTPYPGDPRDTYTPLGFVDKAGNVNDNNIEFYYFDNADGTALANGDLSRADRPESASGSLAGARGDTDGDGTDNVEIRFDQNDAAQVILVEESMVTSGATAGERFNLLTGGGDDTINILGRQYTNTGVYMGDGEDAYTSGRLFGSGNRESIIVDMGEGNNRVLITEPDPSAEEAAIQIATIRAGGGDDLLNVTSGGIWRSNISLGDGNNQILTADDISLSTIITGSGDDLLRIDDTSGEFTNRELDNSTVDLGGGNNTIEILDGEITGTTIVTGDGDDRVTTNNFIGGGSEFALGAGNDVVDANFYIINSEIDMGDGDDIVTVGINQANDNDIQGSTINLGAGNDLFIVEDQLNNTWINGDAGDDIIVIGGMSGFNPLVNGGEGNDRLYIEGDDTINISQIGNVEEIYLTGLDRTGLIEEDNAPVANGNIELNIAYQDVIDGGTVSNVRIYGDANDTVDFGNNGSRNGNIDGSRYQDNNALITSNQTYWNRVNTTGPVTDENGVEFNVWQYQDDASHQIWVQTDINII